MRTDFSKNLFDVKTKKKRAITFLLILAALLIGLFVGFGTIFTMSVLVIFIICFFLTTLVAGIFDLIRKSKYFIYPGIGLLTLTIASSIAIGVFKVLINIKQGNAEEIITNLQNYKVREGQYPDSIEEFSGEYSIGEFNYRPDSTNQDFVLSYSLNGWDQKYYESKTKEWIVSD